MCLAGARSVRGRLLGVAALSKLEFVCYALRAFIRVRRPWALAVRRVLRGLLRCVGLCFPH